MLLSENPSTQSPVSVESLHQLFELRADIQAQRPAIIDQSATISYGEVEARSNQLAKLLRRRGVVCGDRIGLLLPRSPELYIAILAILKAGGAYVPLDPDYPVDRIEYILTDCAVRTIVTTADLARTNAIQIEEIICVDRIAAELMLCSIDRFRRDELCVSERDLSYVIYTSGSTGKPKGVEIEHRSSLNYIQVVNETVYQITPQDRVYQGCSIAFDASVEEVWCTFAAGAALVVGSVDTARSGVDLAQFLTQARVTVLSCVPTLLAMMEIEVPTIRLLILGGEQCPQALAQRWCNSQRRVINTYGPTEATVVATWHECQADQPITLGRPLPTYQVYLLDEELQPVPAGVAGEIHIGGICLARGYVNRPDLTAEKFIPNPFSISPQLAPRLYKTGDLASWTIDGEIEFLGRIDGQVKLRGFRIELAEIESVIMGCAGVSAAVVAVKQIVAVDRLVAYLVPKQDGAIDVATIWATMRSNLPTYMIPASVELVDNLPTFPSGKVDRQRLPTPQNLGANLARTTTGTLPSNQIEAEIAAVWSSSLGSTEISIDDDFFTELGGHSLLAAIVVSKLRESERFRDLAVLDIYTHPTISQLATALINRWQQPQHATQIRKPAPPRQQQRQQSAQIGWASIGIYFLYAIYGLPLLVPGLIFDRLSSSSWTKTDAVGVAAIAMIGLYPALVLLSIAIKWLVIGRFRPGYYPLWSTYYWRFWFVRQVLSIVPLQPLTGSPFINWYCRLMGANIGKDVYLGTSDFLAYDLVEIGAGSSISADSSLLGCEIVDGWLKIGRIQIGAGCYVGVNTILGLNTQIEAGAEIGDLSYLPDDRIIPSGECWHGSPAQPQAATLQPAQPTLNLSPRGWQGLLTIGYGVGIIAQWVVVAIAATPGFLLWQILINQPHWYLWLLPISLLGSGSFTGIFCLQVVIFKHLLIGKVRSGNYPLHSSFGWRYWFVDRLLEMSLEMVPTLYSTLYLLPWLRLLGMKIGARTEISTVTHFTPDLISIGSASFIADSVSLCNLHVKHGWIELAPIQIGSQAFIGNGALVPGNTLIADSCLIGCMSTPPQDPLLILPDSAWIGSPALHIPHRQIVDEYPAAETYQPDLQLYWQRLAIEFCRVTVPGAIHFIVLLGLEFILINAARYWSWWAISAVFPVIYCLSLLCSALVVIALKWSIVGRYQPGTIPLWSDFVWRTEFITGLYESIVVADCLNFLMGTTFAPMVLRCLGMRIGKGVYLETTDFTEFDLISIGDDVILNNGSTLQTHLFEDRVMKMERLRLEQRCQVGTAAVILYDTILEPDVLLHPMSLIMKGERLPGATSWQGIPASRVYDRLTATLERTDLNREQPPQL